MASDGSVTISITGDAEDLERELRDVQDKLKGLKTQEEQTGKGGKSIGTLVSTGCKVAAAAVAALTSAAGVAALAAYKDGVEYLTASGYDAVCILQQRCLNGGTAANELEHTNINTGIKQWMDRCFFNPTNKNRVVKQMGWQDNSELKVKVNATGTWANLWESISEVLQCYQVGIRCLPRWNNTDDAFGIQLYQGKNRTLRQSNFEPVVFSDDLQTISTYDYYCDKSEFCDVAYVGGELKNEDKETRELAVTGVTNATSSGINRFELYVDARDLQKKR